MRAARLLRYDGCMSEEGDLRRDERITALLGSLKGDRARGDELMRLVYEDLRGIARGKLAGLRPGETVQATELVHEAWLRLLAAGASEFKDRAHFFGAAANAMRNHMVELARRKSSLKRDGSRKRELPDDVPTIDPGVDLGEVLAVHEALEKLATMHERPTRIVTLRYFGGLALPEVAEVMDVSLATAERDWRFARSWLQREMAADEP
jgi:RNA polymerase sigma factor (TIGR02999 family)